MSERIPTTTIDFDPNVNKVYTRRTQGFYQRLRRYTGIPLLLSYVLIPWLTIADRPAVWFDFSAQRFHILWMTFWPQDGILLASLLILAAFLLFIATILVGRIWCGFTCPQTVWTMMFIWAEDKCEGDRNARIKLDQQSWSLNRVFRKSAKHGIWLFISLVTGITFVGYFYPVRDLLAGFFLLQASAVVYFWVFFFVGFTYLNAGWLRESVCKHMCPYARFQSVMYDKDTMVVTYDAARGEPRTTVTKSTGIKPTAISANIKGACVDCSWCVQVCPVDIDIRDGMQYACIDCGLCVDACNNVMDKVGDERGLIRFTSQHALDVGHTQLFRPRLVAYLAAATIMTGLFAHTILTRSTVGLDVVRDRGEHMYHSVDNGFENVYTVKINNMGENDQTYLLSVEGEADGGHLYVLKGPQNIHVRSGETIRIPVRVWRENLDNVEIGERRDSLVFVVHASNNIAIMSRQEASFISPIDLASVL